MGRIEHELVFCPVCNGHAGCFECQDGRTFEAYCETQAAYQAVVNEELAEVRAAQCAQPEEGESHGI